MKCEHNTPVKQKIFTSEPYLNPPPSRFTLAERKGTLAYYNKYVANSENSDLSSSTPNSSKNSAGSGGGQQNQNEPLLSVDGNLKSPRNVNVKYNPKAVKSTQNNKAANDNNNGKSNDNNSKKPLVEVDGSKKSGGCCSIL